MIDAAAEERQEKSGDTGLKRILKKEVNIMLNKLIHITSALTIVFAILTIVAAIKAKDEI